MTYQEAQNRLREVALLSARERSHSVSALAARSASIEFVTLEKALDRVLSSDVVSELVSPPFANSAMDGFAMRASETLTQSKFKVCGSLYPGDLPPKETPIGAAWEITTGAPLPLDCNAIVKIEDVARSSRDEKLVEINAPLTAGEFIRPAGQDYQRGSIVVLSGTRLMPLHLMALASVNCSSIPVFKKPRVVLLPTGRELYQAGGRGEPGQIVNSSAVYLSSVWKKLGCDVEILPVLRDDPAAFEAKLDELLLDPPDLLVTTGAVSMGNADFIRPGLEKKGFAIHFHRVPIRPGKPILFAEKKTETGRLVVFGLPGNPISSVVGSRFFVQDYLDVLLSNPPPSASKQLKLAKAFTKPEGLRCFFRGRMRGEFVELHSEQGSSLVRPLVESDVWVILPEVGTRVEAGEMVEVQPY